MSEAPLPALLFCPMCHRQHIDEGIWQRRLHHRHRCLACGFEWRVEPYCVGVLRPPGVAAAAPVQASAPPPGVTAMSPRQAEALQWIIGYQDMHGYAPTVREIGDAMAIRSTNGVLEMLVMLARKGWLSWAPGRSRTLRVLHRPATDNGAGAV